DEALRRVEELPDPVFALRDDGDGDGGALPLVLVADLGDGDAEAVPQAVDDRADGGALRLERPARRHVELEGHRRGVHLSILAVPGRWCASTAVGHSSGGVEIVSTPP